MLNRKQKDVKQKTDSDTAMHQEDWLIAMLRHVINGAVRVLAVLMTAVIIWGVADVIMVLHEKLTDQESHFMLLNISEILQTFGAFMAVLIAIEIFVNITIYLRDDVIHVKIVMATAVMAVARKIIVLDLEKMTYMEVFAVAAVAAAMFVGYWFVVILDRRKASDIR